MHEQKGGPAFTNAPASTGDRTDGARSPEELETLLEDALLTGDLDALVNLFEAGAVLTMTGDHSARNSDTIAELALATWCGEHSYVADPRAVIQARDIALVVTGRGVNVVRRGNDGAWRYAIVHQSGDDELEESDDNERRSGPGIGADSRVQRRG